jgi:hypothetical protein
MPEMPGETSRQNVAKAREKLAQMIEKAKSVPDEPIIEPEFEEDSDPSDAEQKAASPPKKRRAVTASRSKKRRRTESISSSSDDDEEDEDEDDEETPRPVKKRRKATSDAAAQQIKDAIAQEFQKLNQGLSRTVMSQQANLARERVRSLMRLNGQ